MSDRLMNHNAAMTNIVRRIAYAAGNILMDYFEEEIGMQAEIKSDGSPVTDADREAEDYIRGALKVQFSSIPFVGEEAAAAGDIPDIGDADYFWLVDALDGTRSFVAGNPDFTVNIALMKRIDDQWQPLLGVVYAPAKGELYAGHEPGSAVRWLQESNNEKPIQTREQPKEGLTVMVSRNHKIPEKIQQWVEEFKIQKFIEMGSSLKSCTIAAGKADVYPRFGLLSEWDIAAAHAVLRAAGGDIRHMDGRAITYGQSDKKFETGRLLAASNDFWQGFEIE